MKPFIIFTLITINSSFLMATPVSYRSQTNEQQVQEDKNSALSNISEDFGAYCEWQALDKTLYKLEGLDSSAIRFGGDVQNPFKVEKHIDKYRTAKKDGFLDDARSIFYEYAEENNHKSLLVYSQFGSHQVQERFTPSFSFRHSSSGLNNLSNIEKIKKYFSSLLENLKNTYPVVVNYTDLHDQLFVYGSDVSNPYDLKSRATELLGLCSFLSPLNGRSCRNAILDNEDLFAPKSFTNDSKLRTAQITAAPILKEVLYGVEYTKVLGDSAKDFLSLIVKDSVPRDSNAFEILHKNFISSGLSESESKTMATNIMATLATGGGNFIIRLMDRVDVFDFPQSCVESCNINSIYLLALAESIVILDYLKMKEHGQTFSFPKEVSYECNLGDWYHFWMAAAFSRRMKAKGYSNTISKLAPFVLSSGYHVGNKYLLTKQRFGTIINSSMQDLMLSVLGNRYGLDELQNTNFVVSESMHDYISQLGINPPITQDDASKMNAISAGVKNSKLMGLRYLMKSVLLK